MHLAANALALQLPSWRLAAGQNRERLHVLFTPCPSPGSTLRRTCKKGFLRSQCSEVDHSGFVLRKVAREEVRNEVPARELHARNVSAPAIERCLTTGPCIIRSEA